MCAPMTGLLPSFKNPLGGGLLGMAFGKDKKKNDNPMGGGLIGAALGKS